MYKIIIADLRLPASWGALDQLFDEHEFRSIHWQRVFQYLHRFDLNQNLYDVNPNHRQGTMSECLDCLLRYDIFVMCTYLMVLVIQRNLLVSLCCE